jgi:peptide/nickel transport system substrate-binding protein
MGPVFEDVDHITAVGDERIEIGLKRTSPFVQEALEVPVRSVDPPGSGTGPFEPVDRDTFAEFHANASYYLGRPTLDRILVTNYPNVRAAWAELLRGQIDMLYEVGVDALDSLQSAQNVKIFTFTQPYQYVLFFNTSAPALHPSEVRKALSVAVDRDALVNDALSGHALPSTGPIWPHHWAFSADFPAFKFDQRGAAAALSGRKLRFTCLVRPDHERMALVLKRQFEAVGVEMLIQETSFDQAMQALVKNEFEAVLFDPVSGPSVFRPYEMWRTGGSLNLGQRGTPQLDVVLDRIRHAASPDEYRNAVAAFQRAMVDDPPAIFLAWSERARAVSTRFDVAPESGRDILSTLRLWRPVAGAKIASRN